MTAPIAQRALVRNAADTKQVKRAKETESQRMEREREEWKEVTGSRAGKRVLWAILAFCEGKKTSIERDNNGAIDPFAVVNNEGKRNVGLFIETKINEADPDAYGQMQKDARRLAENIDEPAPRSDEPFEDDDNG